VGLLTRAAFVKFLTAGLDVDRPAFRRRDDMSAVGVARRDNAAAIGD
jgi:hypothetical protein